MRLRIVLAGMVSLAIALSTWCFANEAADKVPSEAALLQQKIQELMGKCEELAKEREYKQASRLWDQVGQMQAALPFFETRKQTLARETDAQKAVRSELYQLGGFIVFQMEKEGNTDIYRVDITGTNLTRLTTHPGEDTMARLSHDGKRFIFLSNREVFTPGAEKQKPGGVFIGDVDGKEAPVKVMDGTDWQCAWSPDDQALICARYDKQGNANLAIYVLDSKQTIEITPPNTRNCFRPDWHPSGNWILTTWQRPGANWTVACAAIDTSTYQLTGKWFNAVASDGCNWQWSRDGKKIAWVRDHSGDSYSSINCVDFTPEKKQRARAVNLGFPKGATSWNYCPTFTSDSKYIIYTHGPNYQMAKILNWKETKYHVDQMDLYAVPVEGGQSIRLTWIRGAIRYHDWGKKK